jgi:hypothetical protein
MDSKEFRETLHQVTIDGKEYALVPLCTFDDMTKLDFFDRNKAIEDRFGLKDTICSFNLYEVSDPKKVMMAKIKYGI